MAHFWSVTWWNEFGEGHDCFDTYLLAKEYERRWYSAGLVTSLEKEDVPSEYTEYSFAGLSVVQILELVRRRSLAPIETGYSKKWATTKMNVMSRPGWQELKAEMDLEEAPRD